MAGTRAAQRRFAAPVGLVSLLTIALGFACEHPPPPTDSPDTGPATVAASAAATTSIAQSEGRPESATEPEPELESEPEPQSDPHFEAVADSEGTSKSEPQLPPPGPRIEFLEKGKRLKHIPVPMETLQQVAARYDVKVEALRKWNELSEDFVLEKVRKKPKLRIFTKRISPPRERVEHEVIEGDTWGQLARRYGAASTDIRAYNVRKLGRHLEPGEIVQIWIDPVIKAEIDRGPNEFGLRRGAYSIGSPNEGRLVNGVEIPPSEDYELGHPNSAWGTTFAVSCVVRAMSAFRRRSGYGGRIKIGTMSRQRGGEVGGHKSHQSGRDLDIRLPVKEDVPQKIRPLPYRVDWLATWYLIDAFEASGDAAVIFFDYKLQRRIAKAALEAGVAQSRLDEVLQWPIGSKSSRGFVRHEPGHEEHIHVRLSCGTYETECLP
jgi:LysM repeat protein